MEANGEKRADGKEGSNLLGSPTFTELQNGRLKCVETGHEMLQKDKDSYSQSKRCRLGLIDFALANKKPPLNMFKQHPTCRSKLVCKLTGDTVNKSEEHIWKHINGRRFLNKLEQKEMGKLLSNDLAEEGEQKLKKEPKLGVDGTKKSGVDGVKKSKKKKEKKSKKEKKEKLVEEIIPEVRDSSNKDSDSEEADFWMPPAGERWDFDDGGDRWGSGYGSELEQESDGENGTEGPVEDGEKESEELSTRTKRPSIEIGPSSVASRKKGRKNPTC
ncbi:hypothetical protein SLE2022_194040 [Rubroshorea leprosula]